MEEREWWVTWQDSALVVPQAHHEDVRPLPPAPNRQLGKHGANLTGVRRAADPVLHWGEEE